MAVRHLTARNVDTIKPTAKLQALRDSVEKGLELRIRPASKSGAKSWSVRYRIHGQQRRWKLGDYPKLSLADAREQARAKLRDVALGIDPHAQREAAKRQREVDARRVTFGSLAQTYIEKVSAPGGKRTWKVDRRYLQNECKAWKARLAADITRADVRELIDAITARPAPIVANRVLEIIKSVFSFALDRELVEVDPTVRCPSNRENPRKRELTDDEIRQFWRAFDTQPAAMAAGWRLRLLTGQRGGEVFNMEWRDLNLDAGWWTIPGEKAKNGKAHRVPLSAPALEIIKALAVEKGELAAKKRKVLPRYVLDGARGRRQRGAASRATGLADFIGHDLRRAVATGMARLGIEQSTIARVLNHSDNSVTAKHYNLYSYDAEKRAALDSWATALDAILAKGGSSEVKGAASRVVVDLQDQDRDRPHWLSEIRARRRSIG
jgi:integrase